jgi:hypothetical protein
MASKSAFRWEVIIVAGEIALGVLVNVLDRVRSETTHPVPGNAIGKKRGVPYIDGLSSRRTAWLVEKKGPFPDSRSWPTGIFRQVPDGD